MSRLNNAIQRVRQQLNLELRTGKIVAVAGTVRDSASGGYYVAINKASGGYYPPVPIRPAPNAVIDPAVGIPVRIGFDRQLRQDVILAMLPRVLEQQGLSPFRTNPADPAAADLIPQERIAPLYSRPSTDPSKPFYAVVYPAALIKSTAVVTYDGGELNLASLQPSAGNHRYVMVFIKSDFATLEAAGSTTQATGTPLDDTDLTEAFNGRTASSIPIRAYKMTGSDTALDGNFANSPFVRQFINELAFVGTAANIKQTEVDFGASPLREKEFTITDADVGASSQLIGGVAYEAPTGRALDEVEAETFDLKFGPGSGQFTVRVRSLDGRFYGKLKLNYLIG